MDYVLKTRIDLEKLHDEYPRCSTLINDAETHYRERIIEIELDAKDKKFKTVKRLFRIGPLY